MVSPTDTLHNIDIPRKQHVEYSVLIIRIPVKRELYPNNMIFNVVKKARSNIQILRNNDNDNSVYFC